MGSSMSGIKLHSANNVESGLLKTKGHPSYSSKKINGNRSFLGHLGSFGVGSASNQ
jgi:hypothetical protein